MRDSIFPGIISGNPRKKNLKTFQRLWMNPGKISWSSWRNPGRSSWVNPRWNLLRNFRKKLVESQRDLLDELWFWKEISQMDLPEGSHKISRLLEESWNQYLKNEFLENSIRHPERISGWIPRIWRNSGTSSWKVPNGTTLESQKNLLEEAQVKLLQDS